MKERPTKEQVARLWKWCGFIVKPDEQYPTWEELFAPTGERIMGSKKITPDLFPEIDLNNLFKWAAPKLEPIQIHFKRQTAYPEHIGEINCWFYYQEKQYAGWGTTPTLALFWAIYDLIEFKSD